MGYRVEYGPAPEKEQSFFGKNRGRILTVVFLLLLVLAVKVLWPAGTAALCNALLPGDASSTQTAFAELVENLRSGQGFSEAMTTFCREIIADAGISFQ